jgi:hypothetical protein
VELSAAGLMVPESPRPTPFAENIICGNLRGDAAEKVESSPMNAVSDLCALQKRKVRKFVQLFIRIVP